MLGHEPLWVKQGYAPELDGKASIRGTVMSGMARSYMNDVCGSANALGIQDGKVNVVPETAYMPGSVPVISHETGLVGMPAGRTASSCMLLNPSIRVGG